MAESPSSNQATVETGPGIVAAAGEMPATVPPVVTDANGVPVLDLREAPGKDGAFVVIDGELVIRLADGTEWPISTTAAAGEIVLQLADQAFVSASAVQAAIEAFDTALPVADLAATAAREAGTFPDSAIETVAAPQAESAAETTEGASEDESGEPVSGGAAFRTIEPVALGETLELTLQLGPTSLDQDGDARFIATPLDDGSAARGSTARGSIAVNFAPVAGNDSATTSERQSVQIDVLRNDSDPNKYDSIKLVDVDTTGLAGEVVVNADGSLTYDPNGQFTHLGKGETATERFTYKVVDSQGAVDTATVEVTVTGVNDTPIAVDDTVVTDERTVVALDLLSNDSDPDTNDTLEVVAIDTADLAGAVGLLPDGSLAYSPNGAFTHLGLGEYAIDTFLYAVADQHGAYDIAEVSVRVEGVNDAPIAVDDLVWVSQEGHARFDALANDIDPDTNDTLRVVSLHSLGGSQGQRWINHDGTVSYRPYGAYDYLGEGEIAYQQFGYTVADQHGATDTGVITAAIVGLNDAPVANDDHATTDEKSTVALDIFANDVEIDINDIVQLVAVDTSTLKGQLFITPEGMLGYDPNGQFLHLGVGEQATERFTYTIADQHGASSTATVEVTVTGVNDAPTAVTDEFVGFENVGFYAPIDALLANDFDVDGDHFAFAGLGPALNGEVSLTPDGFVVFKPDAGYIGDASFQYAIQDEYGAFGFGEVDVHVREIAPGDVAFETLILLDTVSDAEIFGPEAAVSSVDMVVGSGALAGVAMTIGGMPFFSAILEGVLFGEINAVSAEAGQPDAVAEIFGDLALDIDLSPIFTALGGDFYDALLAATSVPSGGQGDAPDAPLPAPDATEPVSSGSAHLPLSIAGNAFAESEAIAFGDGRFYLDIAGIVDGLIVALGEDSLVPDLIAEVLGEFAGEALIDIRDGVDVASSGFVDTHADVVTGPAPLVSSADPLGTFITDDAVAMAA